MRLRSPSPLISRPGSNVLEGNNVSAAYAVFSLGASSQSLAEANDEDLAGSRRGDSLQSPLFSHASL